MFKKRELILLFSLLLFVRLVSARFYSSTALGSGDALGFYMDYYQLIDFIWGFLIFGSLIKVTFSRGFREHVGTLAIGLGVALAGGLVAFETFYLDAPILVKWGWASLIIGGLILIALLIFLLKSLFGGLGNKIKGMRNPFRREVRGNNDRGNGNNRTDLRNISNNIDRINDRLNRIEGQNNEIRRYIAPLQEGFNTLTEDVRRSATELRDMLNNQGHDIRTGVLNQERMLENQRNIFNAVREVWRDLKNNLNSFRRETGKEFRDLKIQNTEILNRIGNVENLISDSVLKKIEELMDKIEELNAKMVDEHNPSTLRVMITNQYNNYYNFHETLMKVYPELKEVQEIPFEIIDEAKKRLLEEQKKLGMDGNKLLEIETKEVQAKRKVGNELKEELRLVIRALRFERARLKGIDGRLSKNNWGKNDIDYVLSELGKGMGSVREVLYKIRDIQKRIRDYPNKEIQNYLLHYTMKAYRELANHVREYEKMLLDGIKESKDDKIKESLQHLKGSRKELREITRQLTIFYRKL